MSLDKHNVARTTELIDKSMFYSDSGVVNTPLLYSEALSKECQCEVYLKCENVQTTGSFKIRGATSAMLGLSESDKKKGVLTASSGNHGAATAMAAKALGIPVTIYVPSSINPAKEQKILSCGANLIKVPGATENAERAAAADALEKGLTYISPYNELAVMAGQGTLAQEILKELPSVDAIFASVGGGGLIGGIGSTIKTLSNSTQIVGCWPENAPTMLECMKAGKIIDVKEQDTLSDGTAGGLDEDAITLPVCLEVIDTTVTVSEKEIAQAMKFIFQHHEYVVEGAAGVAVASLIKSCEKFKGQKVVLVLCGGNISAEKFDSAMNMV